MAGPVSRAAVQFRNIDDVVEAYVNNNVCCFAIWQQRQLMFPYECDNIDDGAGYLQALLEKLKNSPAIYTLCVYKEIGPAGIVNNTPFNASFNFQLKRLQDDNGGYLEYRGGGVSPEILSRLEALTVAVSELKAERQREYEEETEEQSLGMIGKILEHPTIAGLIKGFFENKSLAQIPKNVGMAGITEDQRLNNALATLKSLDERLVEHLEKLAQIATNSPENFKAFLGYLDAM